ncbi:MAG TPA: phosphate ABC transporter permease subunit PstC [Actinomycetota bacterium]
MPAGTRRNLRLGDTLFRGGTRLIASGLIVLLVLLVAVLAVDGFRPFQQYGLHFLTGRNWNPVRGRESFGALPFIYGTVVTSAIGIALAIPVSVGLALLLNEVARGWFSNVLAVLVDLLAAIPSVVYGLWGVFVLQPVMDRTIEPFLAATLGKVPVLGALFAPNVSGGTQGGDLFTAGVILGIMILPIVTAVAREVVMTVPRDLREAALALGSTRYEMIRMAVLPYSRSGIVGASMLGLGRALGETIAVAMVVGNGLGIHVSLFNSGSTIPSVIANEFREASSAGLHKASLLALALVLIVIALIFAALSRLLIRRSAALVSAEPAPEALETIAFRGGEGGLP